MKRVNLCDLDKVTVEVPKQFAFCLTNTQQILWLYNEILGILENGGGGGGVFDVTIGDNGNWYVNGEDTGKPSRGEVGPAGADGEAGPAGPTGPTGPAGKDGAQGPAGADGFSPTVEVEGIEGGHHITITDKDGEHTFDVLDGKGGGEAAAPTIGDNGNWYVNGEDTGKPSRGEVGPAGADGKAGPAGPIGPAGPAGKDGAQGPAGPTGPAGKDGAQGPAGADGFSPTVEVEGIEGGHHITITDKVGPHEFDVLNGTGGSGAATETHTTSSEVLYRLLGTTLITLADDGDNQLFIATDGQKDVTVEIYDTGKVVFSGTLTTNAVDEVEFFRFGTGPDNEPLSIVSKYNAFVSFDTEDGGYRRLRGFIHDGIYFYDENKPMVIYVDSVRLDTLTQECEPVLLSRGVYDSGFKSGSDVTFRIEGHFVPTI